MTEWPSKAEIAQATARLWTGNLHYHTDIVVKVLAEIRNMREQSERSETK